MLDFKALEQALNTIGKLGNGEWTVEIDNIPVVLRLPTADEDAACLVYAHADERSATPVQAGERYKRMLIACCIQAIGPLDLRGVTHVSTGEVLPNGVEVKISKIDAVRKILESWTSKTILLVVAKISELARRKDDELDKAIKFDLAEVDAEIKRLEARLKSLQEQKDKAKGPPIPALPFLPAEKPQVREPAVPEPDPEPEPEPPNPQVVPPRQRVGPRAPLPPPEIAPEPRPVYDARIPSVFDDIQDSMSTDENAMEQENRRLLAARNLQQQRSRAVVPQDAPDMLTGNVGGRVPGPRAAANLADAMLEQQQQIQASRPKADIGDTPTMALETEHITGRAPPRHVEPAESLDPHRPTNPRYRGKV